MLDGIDMDVIHMARAVAFVPNQMLPVAALPDIAFPLGYAAWRTAFRRKNLPGESCLDEHPALGKVRVASR